MGKKLKIMLIIVLLAIVVVGAYILVPKYLKQPTPADDPKKPTVTEPVETSKKISMESIKELAKKSKIKIDTTLVTKIHIDNEEGTGENIYLELEDGKVYLSLGRHRSLITSVKDKAVMIKNANNDCNTTKQNILILTENGDLFLIGSAYNGEQRFQYDVTDEIKKDSPIELPLDKLNSIKKERVLAFTEYHHNSSCRSCGKGDLVVITEANVPRVYNTMEEVKSMEKTEICGGPLDIYMTIYEDGRAANKEGWTLQNRYNNDLMVKETFRVDNTAYILDHLNYLYTVKNVEDMLVVELYRDTRVLTFDVVSNNIHITFESGHSIDFTNWKYIDEY